ncbi:hypothetical protein [Caballeronia sordidicola]|uniref:hypothetical protein n=1 Tax=Caballeronia sordidicola TaxID=196367 RepID=UPI001C4FC356|nr:hypothetical protein [Caballeronia sordidicola]
MNNDERLPPLLLKRKAVVYVRQSTQTQVQMNVESKRRQYDLVQEAKRRGFRDIEAKEKSSLLPVRAVVLAKLPRSCSPSAARNLCSDRVG